MSKNYGIILAGGIGSRFGSNVPKQYMKLNGKEIVSYSIEAFKNAQKLENFVVVVNIAEFEEQKITNKFDVLCTVGGGSRNESINKGLEYINKHFGDCDNVIIHDGVRPFLTANVIDDYFEKLNSGYDAIITAQPITDYLGNSKNEYLDRSEFQLLQAPAAYNTNYLLKYFDKDSEIISVIHQLPKEAKICKSYVLKNNLKITYKEDLLLANLYIKSKTNEDIVNG